jgi:signal peptidase I
VDSHRSNAREYLEALLIAVIFALFVRTFVFQAFKIPSGSMEENLLVGDHIVVNKFIYGRTDNALERWLLPAREVRRGDVMVFKYPDDPSRDFIKRCVGLPGDEIEMVDKTLFVNGEEVDDASYTYRTDPRVYSRSSYLPPAYSRRDNFGPYVVPPASYFCLGDNRDNSRDSRFWSHTTVPAEYVKGRAVMVYWSFDASYAGQANQGGLGRIGFVARNFLDRTRWERTFRVVR